MGRDNWPQIESLAIAKLVRTLAASWLALLALAAILVCIRRSSGALTQPLPPQALVAWGALLALAALTFRKAYSAATSAGNRLATYALWAAPSGVLALWAASLSLSGSATSGLLGLWGLLLVEEGWSWGRLWHEQAAPARQPVGGLRPQVVKAATPSGMAVIGEAEDEPDASVTQQIVRRRQSDRSEGLEGWVRADLAASQRHATAHIAICPPLDGLPECFAEQLDGPPAAIKVAQVLPYGVRFEIKLDKPAQQATSVLVEFSIQSRPSAAP